MAQFVGQLFWTHETAGWSETYYLIDVDIAGCIATLNGLQVARRKLLASDCALIYARISDVAIKGDSTLVDLSYPLIGTNTAPGTQDGGPALLYSERAGVLTRASRWLRMLPNTQFTNGLYVPTGGFTTDLNAYITLLIADTLLRKEVKPRTTPKTYTYHNVTDVIFRYLGSRQYGRPFGLPRGRRLIA